MAPMKYSTTGKDIIAPMEYTPMFYSPNGKDYFERLLFEMVIVIAKDKKYSINNTISIKISFMHYMYWKRVMLPVVFEEFKLVCISFLAVLLFCLCFLFLFFAISFHCQCQLVKSQLWQISGGIGCPRFLRAWY